VSLSLSGLASGNLVLSGANITDIMGVGTTTKTIGEQTFNPGTYYVQVYQSGSPAWYTLNVSGVVTSPVLTAALANDTAPNGLTNNDRLTKDPTILGQVSTDRAISYLKAGLDNTPSQNFVDVTAALQPNGQFTLTPAILQQINGGVALTDGTYTLHLQLQDAYNLSATQDLTFTLDTAVAPPTSVKLAPDSDSGQSNSDGVTNHSSPTVIGNAEAGSIIQILSNGQIIGQTTVAFDGSWQVQLNSLANGTYSMIATATDAAGNIRCCLHSTSSCN
jgi:hypothetical protein